MKQLCLVLALVLCSCAPKAAQVKTKVTMEEMVKAINEDRRSITLLSNSLLEVIKKFNEIAPPDKRFKEYKKKS